MNRVPSVGILGIGVFLPEEVRTNDWWPEPVVERWRAQARESLLRPEREPELPDLGPGARAILAGMASVEADPFRGVRERRVKAPGTEASDMEAAAARRALAAAGVSPGEVDLLLSNSQLPDYLGQPTAARVHHLLGLSPRCFTFGVDASSNGFLSQLSVAEQLVRSGRARCALLVQSSGWQHLVPRELAHSAWFGDAATAVVVGPVRDGLGLLGQAHGTDGTLFEAMVVGTPGGRWYEGKPVTLYPAELRQAREMLIGIADRGKWVLDAALTEAALGPEDVGFYACHQSTAWFRAVTQAFFGLTNAASYDFFPRTGSLSACNIPFALAMAEREGHLQEGDVVATHAGGSGICFSSVVLRWGR
ncbi:3-oxoacyl-ACP synthase III family protein [Sorangium sp. So ce117]|uniref:3-oxoacyl-ACP synthase III family protein n=1 Tax=Sorangium sp. So ce117 TaxID=3133277 RepID=UPI003F61C555